MKKAIRIIFVLPFLLVVLFGAAVPTLRDRLIHHFATYGRFIVTRYGFDIGLFTAMLTLNLACIVIMAKAAPQNRLGQKLQHMTGRQLDDSTLNEELTRRLAKR